MSQASVESVIRISSCNICAQDMENILEVKGGRLVEPKDNDEARLILESNLPDTMTVEEQLGSLCATLEEKQSKISLLPSDTEIDIWCTVYCKGEFAGFGMDSVLLKRLSDLSVNVVFSVYDKDED